MSDKKNNGFEDFQKDFEDFIQKRFGGAVQVLSSQMGNLASKTSEEPQNDGEEKPKESKKEGMFSFHHKPKDIKRYLDRFVVGQQEAKTALSVAVCDHYHQVMAHQSEPEDRSHKYYAKQNVLLLGPTGVGKTFLVKQLADLIGVPFVKADATRYSETGYMGANVEDILRDLVNQADGDVEKAQYGIVYLDEVDKLAGSGHSSSGKDVSGRGVQLGLLKIMEETEVDLRSGNDPASQMQLFMDMQKGGTKKQLLPTKHILFLVSGAFSGLEEIVAKRVGSTKIGFSQNMEASPTSFLNEVTTEDLTKFGLEPEFIGRLPVRVACQPLKQGQLLEIMQTSEASPLLQYKKAFASYGIDLSFGEDALECIAERAYNEKTGARALLTILEKALRLFKFEMPSTVCKSLHVTKELIQDPSVVLEELLKQQENLGFTKELAQIRGFEESFFEKHNLEISFTREADIVLIGLGKKQGKDLFDLCESMFSAYEHGLSLIYQNQGQKNFVFDKHVVENPSGALEKMVKESFQEV